VLSQKLTHSCRGGEKDNNLNLFELKKNRLATIVNKVYQLQGEKSTSCVWQSSLAAGRKGDMPKAEGVQRTRGDPWGGGGGGGGALVMGGNYIQGDIRKLSSRITKPGQEGGTASPREEHLHNKSEVVLLTNESIHGTIIWGYTGKTMRLAFGV